MCIRDSHCPAAMPVAQAQLITWVSNLSSFPEATTQSLTTADVVETAQEQGGSSASVSVLDYTSEEATQIQSSVKSTNEDLQWKFNWRGKMPSIAKQMHDGPWSRYKRSSCA
eukprot:10772857-Prorocentrum_lima.AAC.1